MTQPGNPANVAPAPLQAKIFISYSRVDEAFARQLAGSLSQMGADVWIDVEDIPAGLKWSSAIQQGLDVADAMLVILSPESMQSVNVEDEWQYFLDQKRPVFPILYRPAKVHFQLSRIQYIDFVRQPYERAILQLNAELRRRGIRVQPMAGAEPPRTQPPISTITQPAPEARRRTPPLALSLGAVVVLSLIVLFVLSRLPYSPLNRPTATLILTGIIRETLTPGVSPTQVADASTSTLAPISPSPSPSHTLTPTATLTRTRRGTPLPPELIEATNNAIIQTSLAQEETDVALTETGVFIATDDALQATLDSFTDTPTLNFTQAIRTAAAGTRTFRTQNAAATRDAATQVIIRTQTQVALVSPTPVPTLIPNPIVCEDTPPTRLNVGMRAYVSPPEPGEPFENVRLRANAGLSGQQVDALEANRVMYVTGQPQCVDGYIWYPVQTSPSTRYESILNGWVAEGAFENIVDDGGESDDGADANRIPNYFIVPVPDQ